MSKFTDEPAAYTQLRDKASARLEAGTAPATTHWTMGVDALRLLHRLSSNPETAEDALKLLHELQVHQVELDLQNEEIAANEPALQEELNHYRALFRCAPLVYLLVARDGSVIEGNLAAAEHFGVAPDDLRGRRVDTLLIPEFRPRLQDLLQRVEQSGGRDSCTVPEKADANGTAGPLQFQASVLPGSGSTLLTCSEGASVG